MIIINPAEQLVFLYRCYSFLFKYKVFKPLSYVLYFFVRVIYSSDIHPNAKIGRNLQIRHHFGIVIGKNVIIGNNCIIYNLVSIGQRNINNYSMPTIGNNVIIYKGATIVGHGFIDNETVISAHALIKLY